MEEHHTSHDLFIKYSCGSIEKLESGSSSTSYSTSSITVVLPVLPLDDGGILPVTHQTHHHRFLKRILQTGNQRGRTFFPDIDNIGIKILVLSSVDLISNNGILTSKAPTGEPNEKGTSLNEEPAPDHDEVETILIGIICNFKNRDLLRGPCLKETQIYVDTSSSFITEKYIKNIWVTHLIFGGSRTTFPKLKSSIYLKNKI